MILRSSSRLLLLAIYAYAVLFAFTRASGRDRYDDSEAENATCVACPVGNYAGDPAKCNCTVCDCPPTDPHCNCSGFCDTNDSCLQCEPGHHADKIGMAVCKECPLGTHYDEYGGVNCTKCAPGSYSDQTGQTQCEPCPPGTNASHTGAPECFLCPLGYTCEDGGCTTCTPCPAGKSSSDNRTSCQLCAYGSYSPAQGHPCETCSRGLICDELGCTECYPCPGGQEPKDRSSVLTCEACKPGTFRRAGVNRFCQSCQPGQVQENYGQEKCEECPERFYCPNPTIKRKCPGGAVCPAGSTTPMVCANLFQYDQSTKGCTPTPMFIGLMVLIVIVAVLVVLIGILAVYCHIHRKKILRSAYHKLPPEKIPLAKEPVKEPVYSGY